MKMKRLLAWIVLLTLVICQLPAQSVHAQTEAVNNDDVIELPMVPIVGKQEVASGTCGENLTWTLDNYGTLTISGTGNMTNYFIWSESRAPWYGYKDTVQKVSIEAGVASIGEYAFENCSKLTEITIPDSVTVISPTAFDGCSKLTGIYVDANNAYYVCDDRGVLYDKAMIVLVRVPGGLLGNYAIPDGVASIGEYAFSGCSGLEDVRIPNSVQTIGVSAFENCSGLIDVEIPDSVFTVGYCAFRGCSNLTGIYVGENNAYYANDDRGVLFSKGMSVLHMVPGGLSGSYVIPDSVTLIDEHAFSGCGNLTDVTIPGGVTHIGYYAFTGCSSLEKAYYAGSQEDWSRIAIQDGNDPLLNAEIVYGEGSEEVPSVVASGTCGENLTWKLDENGDLTISGSGDMTDFGYAEAPWHSYKDTIQKVIMESGVTSVGSYAFYSYSNISSVTIPEGVTSINGYAFYECVGLTEIDIPSTVSDIWFGAFERCSLTEVHIPAGVSNLYPSAFASCSNLTAYDVHKDNPYYTSDENGIVFSKDMTKVVAVPVALTGSYTIPNTVTVIGSSAFAYSSLEQVFIPGSVVAIDQHAFFACKNLTEMIIPEGVTEIGSSAFSNCYELKKVSIPDSVVRVGSNVFSACDNLEYNVYGNCRYLGNDSNPYFLLVDAVSQDIDSCSIHSDTKVISNAAFQNCSNLTEVVIPEGVTGINELTFSFCTGLTKITIPGTGTVIDNYAFLGCTGLEKVVISSGVTSIRMCAFQDCTSLTEITIPRTVTFIGRYAFSNCPSLEKVYYGGNQKNWERIDGIGRNDALLDAAIEYLGPDAEPGDMNGDEAISDADALYLLRHTLFPERYPMEQEPDVNNDGAVTDADALYLLRFTLFPERYPLYPNK